MHASRWNAVGEKLAGLAPRGLDHYRVRERDGGLVVDTSEVVRGMPIGTATVPPPRRDGFPCV